MREKLDFYGYKTIEDFAEDTGLSVKEAEDLMNYWWRLDHGDE